MYKGKHIAVVVPSYNESGFVGKVIETVPSFVDRIYPVDDCSTDGTWEEITYTARRMNTTPVTETSKTVYPVTDGGQHHRVVPIRHERNRGVGGAIKTGYRQAVADGADVVAVMNGDGQMDPEMLDRLLDPVVEGKAAYAKGNRLTSSDHRLDMSRFRLFGNVLLTQLTRIASGYWDMADPQNGYTAISVSALETLDLDDVYEGYGFLNDMLIRLNAHDMRIADVDMKAIYGDENSSIRYRTFVPRLSWLLLTQFLWRLRCKNATGNRTVALPYLTGILGGAVTGVLLVLALIAIDISAAGSAFVALIFFLMLIGVGMGIERQQNRVLQLSSSE